jgi:signal transduction histidine kinase
MVERAFNAVESAWRQVGRVLGRSRIIISLAAVLAADDASAEVGELRLSILGSGAQYSQDIAGPLGLLMLGLFILAFTTTVFHIVSRKKWADRVAAQAEEIGVLQGRLQRADIFMSGERHVVVAWGSASSEPEIEGDVALVLGVGAPRRILGFTQWLEAGEAYQLQKAVDGLKARGEGFSLACDGMDGKRLEIDGRAVAGKAVMRIREVSGDRLERIKAQEQFGKLAGEMAALHATLDAIPHPVWLRYSSGSLAWVNQAFAQAVDCRHPNEAISKGLELIDRPQRERIAIETRDGPFVGRMPAIVAGKRRTIDVFEAMSPMGSGGVAVDVSEMEVLKVQLEAEMATHIRTLQQLPIAIATFDRQQRLRFFNPAYQTLWGLEQVYLESRPSDGELLDRLRAGRQLPEQVDFRSWRADLLDAYHQTETAEHVWHLPDRRVLRVVSSPTPDGGVNYVYEDMTERLTLEAQYMALSRVQTETLEGLNEGVAVFGSDGRLKLANGAFSAIWRLTSEATQDRPHIDDVSRRTPFNVENSVWDELRVAVTRIEQRHTQKLLETRSDGAVIECVTIPLPDGATMITFADVTASVNAEQFLRERNEALETSSRVKNEFIKKVSYELRDPLQNVTMAAAMLSDEAVMGPLTPRQSEYAAAALTSAETLLALMNDIFDLASIDAGALELDLGEVSPPHEIAAVAKALADRLAKSGVIFVQDAPENLGCFRGDAKRVRQVLFHLVSNGISFSNPGQKVVARARRQDGYMAFSVKDEGPGIPEAMLPRIFDRFENHPGGANHRGVGLGLSMVKAFVELHGGTVSVKSEEGHGTTITCRFPLGRNLDEPDSDGDVHRAA